MAFLRKAMLCACAACALSLQLQSRDANAEPQNGWWWNPNESGRGYFLEMTGGVMYLAGYFYADDGRATWLSSGGPVTDLYLYKGMLQSYRNGQSVFGAYRLPDTIVDVGPVTVSFTDDSHGTITWPGGTIPIERDIFGDISNADETAFQPKTGWWWNPAESGSGYSVEIQGGSAFVVAFMYDESGNPVWYFAAGPMPTPTHFESDWLEFSGGQTLTGAYRPPATPRNLGRLTIDFAATDDATITFTDNATAKQVVKRLRSSRAGPQLTGPTWTDSQVWPAFTCNATQKFTIVDGAFSETQTYNYTLYFRHLARPYDFFLEAKSYVDYAYDSEDTDTECKKTGRRNGINTLTGQLRVEPTLNYHGRVWDNIGSSLTIQETCTDSPPYFLPQVIFIDFSLGSNQTYVQNPRPYEPTAPATGLPPPWMKAKNSLLLPDGSTSEWEWDCIAGI
jgi:hypothetical protein